MVLASNFNFWAIAGLVYALAGSALFCSATFSNPLSLSGPAGTRADSAVHNQSRIAGQWLDSRVGGTLLVIGFFLQATGAVGTATLNTPAVFVMLGLALFAGYYALARDLLVDRLVTQMVSSPDATSAAEIADDVVAVPVIHDTEVAAVIVEFRQSESAA